MDFPRNCTYNIKICFFANSIGCFLPKTTTSKTKLMISIKKVGEIWKRLTQNLVKLSWKWLFMGFARFELQSQLKLRSYQGTSEAGSEYFFMDSLINMSGKILWSRSCSITLSFWSYNNLCVSHIKVVTL